MTDFDFDLLAGQRARVEFERCERLAFGGGCVSFELCAHGSVERELQPTTERARADLFENATWSAGLLLPVKSWRAMNDLNRLWFQGKCGDNSAAVVLWSVAWLAASEAGMPSVRTRTANDHILLIFTLGPFTWELSILES